MDYYLALFFVLFINPCICLFGAIYYVIISKPISVEEFVRKTCFFYQDYLLHPTDWFSFWRLNCRLISYHSLVTQSPDYRQEDKWTFLVDGKEMDVPVSPYMTIESIVCKNKNIEGSIDAVHHN